MRALFLMIVAALLLGGCLVRTNNNRHSHRGRSSARECPPAYHWNGNGCVHNGKAKGHHKRR